MRWVSTRVLPEPAPARMRRGDASLVTAASWAALRPRSSAPSSIEASGGLTVRNVPAGWDTDGPWHCGGVIVVSEAEFEDLVADALDAIPDELVRPARQRGRHRRGPPSDRAAPGPLRGRAAHRTRRLRVRGVARPDHGVPTADLCRRGVDGEEVVEIVRVTVVHEVAHHFGIDDDQLDELGWA